MSAPGDADPLDASGAPDPTRLPAIATGEGHAWPAVFLHGFAGAGLSWRPIQRAIAADRPTLAFDLPGHAGAKAYPGFGPPKVAARAVLAELDRRGLDRVHVVGHSMGGAVAALMALTASDRLASLVLLAPGGFGPEIGIAPLRAIVEGDPEAGLIAMGAPGWRPDVETLALHREIAALQSPTALAAIFALLFRGGTQGMLPLDAVAAMGVPVALVWGESDRVTPFEQSASAPESFAFTALPGVGHMLMDEAPARVVAVIRAALAFAEDGSPAFGGTDPLASYRADRKYD